MARLYSISIPTGEYQLMLETSRRDGLVNFADLVRRMRANSSSPASSDLPGPPTGMLDMLEHWAEWENRLGVLQEFADFTKITGSDDIRTLSLDQARIGPPIRRPPKIMGIAFNNRASERFRDRYDKTGNPGWFLKASTCVVGQDDEVELVPESWSNVTTPEVELGIMIGKKSRWVDRKHAFDVVAGYTIVNDVTAQDLLVASPKAFITAERYFSRKIIPDPGDTWEKDQLSGPNRIEMKQWDTFAPMGPCLVTRNEIPDPYDQAYGCKINGETIMEGRRIELIWDIPEMIAMFSRIMTLEPGDVISGGNLGRLSPKGALKPGDLMEISLSRIGTLRNKCIASKYPPTW